MKLNIGGNLREDGWKIMNIQPGDHVDFVGSITDLSQFADGSFDTVYASHVLEHVHQREVLDTLIGVRRILKPEGELLVAVPDLDILCHLFINPLASVEVKWKTLRMIIGGQVDQFDYHYVGFNEEMLFDFLERAGFSQAYRVESFGFFNDTSELKPYGFTVSLNVIARK